MQRLLDLSAITPWHTTRDGTHQYTKDDWCGYPLLRKLMIEALQQGYPGRFQGRSYQYVNIGDFRYWFMGYPVEAKHIILNRAYRSLV